MLHFPTPLTSVAGGLGSDLWIVKGSNFYTLFFFNISSVFTLSSWYKI